MSINNGSPEVSGNPQLASGESQKPAELTITWKNLQTELIKLLVDSPALSELDALYEGEHNRHLAGALSVVVRRIKQMSNSLVAWPSYFAGNGLGENQQAKIDAQIKEWRANFSDSSRYAEELRAVWQKAILDAFLCDGVQITLFLDDTSFPELKIGLEADINEARLEVGTENEKTFKILLSPHERRGTSPAMRIAGDSGADHEFIGMVLGLLFPELVSDWQAYVNENNLNRSDYPHGFDYPVKISPDSVPSLPKIIFSNIKRLLALTTASQASQNVDDGALEATSPTETIPPIKSAGLSLPSRNLPYFGTKGVDRLPALAKAITNFARHPDYYRSLDTVSGAGQWEATGLFSESGPFGDVFEIMTKFRILDLSYYTQLLEILGLAVAPLETAIAEVEAQSDQGAGGRRSSVAHGSGGALTSPEPTATNAEQWGEVARQVIESIPPALLKTLLIVLASNFAFDIFNNKMNEMDGINIPSFIEYGLDGLAIALAIIIILLAYLSQDKENRS